MQSERIGDELAKKQLTKEQSVKAVETKPLENKKDKQQRPIKGRKLFINIKESWGDLFYVGLNGIEVLDENGKPILITVSPQMEQG